MKFLYLHFCIADFNQNNFTDLEKDLVLANMALSDEEKEFLRKLTEEPTSVSADLTPSKTSFITSPQMPSTLSPIILPTPVPDMLPSQSYKRILRLPTTLGIGFDPTAIEPEAGFKPIHQGQGGSIPTLAFSVMDGAERPPINADLYEKDFLQKRQNILNQLLVNQLTHVSFQIFYHWEPQVMVHPAIRNQHGEKWVERNFSIAFFFNILAIFISLFFEVPQCLRSAPLQKIIKYGKKIA